MITIIILNNYTIKEIYFSFHYHWINFNFNYVLIAANDLNFLLIQNLFPNFIGTLMHFSQELLFSEAHKQFLVIPETLSFQKTCVINKTNTKYWNNILSVKSKQFWHKFFKRSQVLKIWLNFLFFIYLLKVN
jgi:hypothetical protein